MLIHEYLPAINRLPIDKSLTKNDLITNSFQIAAENDLAMYYAPHNDYVNKHAIIILVGITPGWLQMKTAYEAFLSYKQMSLMKKLKLTKQSASFIGSMRVNLITMLNEIGLQTALGLNSVSDLFADKRNLLHTTSLLKYPVFYKDQNYTGHNPSMQHSKLLHPYLFSIFPEELQQLPDSSLIIPLGKKVDEIIRELASANIIKQPCLSGFPHPSGANGHRIKQLAQEKARLMEQLAVWSANLLIENSRD